MVDERELVRLLRQSGGGERLTGRHPCHTRRNGSAAQPQFCGHAERLASAHLVTGALSRTQRFQDILLHGWIPFPLIVAVSTFRNELSRLIAPCMIGVKDRGIAAASP